MTWNISPAEDARESSDFSQLDPAPLVSVLMITYNHADYLAEAIAGVVQQVCDFPFELIIGEDASKDATLQIALDHQKRYPHIIRVIHSEANVGMNANSLRIFAKARGKYVAYCEGDDFWCAPDKLAQQVSLLEKNDQIGIVHTDWTRAHLINGRWTYDYADSVHSRVPSKFLQGDIFKTWFYPKILRTCTILLRKSTLEDWYSSGLLDPKYPFGDSVLTVWITARSQVGYIPAVTAVYRLSPNSALRSGAKARVAFYYASLKFDNKARLYFFNQAEYPNGYRWEAAMGLLLWGWRARDWSAVKDAILDFRDHFTIFSFMASGLNSVVMRLPTLRRQPRRTPRNP